MYSPFNKQDARFIQSNARVDTLSAMIDLQIWHFATGHAQSVGQEDHGTFSSGGIDWRATSV